MKTLKHFHKSFILPSTLFVWPQEGSDWCFSRICHNFHQILLEKTKWHIHTFYVAGRGGLAGDLQNTYSLMNCSLAWHTMKHSSTGSETEQVNKWISSSQLFWIVPNAGGALLTRLPNWSGKGILSFRGRCWIPHEVGSRLRRSTARVTASPADSHKKCKWCFFRCQYVGSAFEPTVDSKQC